MVKRKDSIGMDAVLLAIYLALAPMHQTMVLSSGGTVIKYLAFLLMISCVAQGYLERKRFIIIWDLFWPVMLMLGWFVLSYIWADSSSDAIDSIISIGSYSALILIVGSRRWNDREKNMIMIILILSCLYYAFRLVSSFGTVKRATLSFDTGESSMDSDQNTVAINVGFGALAAFHVFLKEKSGFVKWAALAFLIFIMVGVIGTGSRGGLLAVCLGGAYLVYKYSEIDMRLRNNLLLIIGFILVAYWLVFDLNILQNDALVSRFKDVDVSSMSGRTEIWSQYLSTLLSRPVGFLCGYGSGCDTAAHAAYMGRSWYRASHNDYISILCQAGIPGLLLTCSFVWQIWCKSRKMKNLFGCACIILALVGSVDVNYFKTYGWWNAMLMAYIGIGSGLAGSQDAAGVLPAGR